MSETAPVAASARPLTAPPAAKRIPKLRSHHGHDFVDHYEWLRQKDDPEVIAHLEAENEWTGSATAALGPLRARIFDEIKSRTQETDMSVPMRDGRWWYFSRTVEGKQYSISCRAPVVDPDDWEPPVLEPDRGLPGEQVLLDGNLEAEGHDFFALGSFDVSEDDRFLLWAVDTSGDERYTLRIREIATGEVLSDRIDNTAPGAFFSLDGRFVFYPTVDEAWRPDTIWRHEIGSSGVDAQVFHEPDERFWMGLGISRSKRLMVLELSSKITSEAWVLDADDPTGQFRVVWPRQHGIEYEVDHAVVAGEDWLLILHNRDAVNFELVAEPLAALGTPEQTEQRVLVLPHDDELRLDGVDVYARQLVVGYRRQGLQRLGVARFEHGRAAAAALGELEPREIVFEEPLYTVGTGSNAEWDPPMIRIGYTSLVTPSTVYDYVLDDGELRLRKQQPVLGGFDASRYQQHREWATAADGTRIPISMVWRSDLVQPGAPAPMLLYGYGAYESSVDPGFSVARLSLLDRGVIFAIAHVRGGGELGRHWYEGGKLLNKRNTFTDFVDVADHLIASGFTSAKQLVGLGGSAGGLLMGAVANLAPERFAGILASVPFVDALTSILDPSLPLTVTEWDEWGDPLHDPEVYHYMRGYSPYENVREGVHYPRILATTSLNDTRVLYVEPAKWVARLREAGAEALLKTEMTAGHGGVSGRYETWREIAFEYAWILDVLGSAAVQRGNDQVDPQEHHAS